VSRSEELYHRRRGSWPVRGPYAVHTRSLRGPYAVLTWSGAKYPSTPRERSIGWRD
jgi:hypothetical protein